MNFAAVNNFFTRQFTFCVKKQKKKKKKKNYRYIAFCNSYLLSICQFELSIRIKYQAIRIKHLVICIEAGIWRDHIGIL